MFLTCGPFGSMVKRNRDYLGAKHVKIVWLGEGEGGGGNS